MTIAILEPNPVSPVFTRDSSIYFLAATAVVP